MYQLANFANAFDAIMNHKGAEMIFYHEAFRDTKQKLKNDPNFKGDLFAEATRIVEEKMAYNLKEQVESDVDEEIQEMRNLGKDIPFGYRKRRMKEKMTEHRDQQQMDLAVQTVRHWTLMNPPNGVLGMLQEGFVRATALKPGETAVKGFVKTSLYLTFGLFSRIAVVFAQRSIENIPILSLGLPGIFYELTRKVTDPVTGTKTEIGLSRNPPHVVKQKLAVHALSTTFAALAIANMFKLEEDEEDEKKWVLNPDRWIDITGPGAEYWEQEQLNSIKEGEEFEFKPYTFYIKINGKWHDIISAKYLPQLMPSMAIVGGLRDNLLYKGFKNPNDESFKKFEEKASKIDLTNPNLVLEMLDDIILATGEQTFNMNAQTVQRLSRAKGIVGKTGALVQSLARPYRTAIYPNILRDAYVGSKAALNMADLTGTPMASAISRDVILLDLFTMQPKYDVFGYEVKQVSPFTRAFKSSPIGSTIESYFFPSFRKENSDRFSNKPWELKMLHPTVKVESYYNTHVEYDDRMKLQRYVGEHLAEYSEREYEALKNATDAQYKVRMDIQYKVGVERAKERLRREKEAAEAKKANTKNQ